MAVLLETYPPKHVRFGRRMCACSLDTLGFLQGPALNPALLDHYIDTTGQRDPFLNPTRKGRQAGEFSRIPHTHTHKIKRK